MRRPNFFILGAPKSGTTALHAYLVTHPKVCMSDPKEPHYFNEDFPRFRWAKTEADYLRFFAHATPEHMAIGDASPLYLFSRVAPARIKDFDANARVIVMLRSYVDYLRSYHNHLVYNRDEIEGDLGRAWDLQDDRREGKRIPRTCREARFLQYRELCSLGTQLGRVFDAFDRRQVKVIFFEDFVRDTRAQYLDVLRFLGLQDDGRTEFPKINEAKSHRLKLLGNLTQRPSPLLLSVAKKAKALLGLGRSRVLVRIREANTISKRSARLGPETERRIKSALVEDAALLSSLTGRDVSEWVRS
ncbi:MAG: sulfotransferase [Deltaproteobacteria bacterium]|nr:sulfotransferase [Deltaproteobacteria bacterium]